MPRSPWEIVQGPALSLGAYSEQRKVLETRAKAPDMACRRPESGVPPLVLPVSKQAAERDVVHRPSNTPLTIQHTKRSEHMNIEHTMHQNDRRGGGTGIRRLPAAFILGALLLVQSSSQAQATSPGASGMVDPLVGAWNVLVDVYVCSNGVPIASNGQSLTLFNADGTRSETNVANPALRTPGYGNWTRVDKNEYEFAFKYFRFDTSGAHIGSTIIRHQLFLSDDGSSYTSEGPAEFLDPSDVTQFVVCSSATATRFE